MDAVLNSTSKYMLFKLVGTSWIEVMRNYDTKFIDGGTVGGTANSITLAPAVPIPAYAAKQITIFTPTSNNTAAVQVNTSGKGARDLKKVKGKVLVDLEADDLIANIPTLMADDGTRLILMEAPLRNALDGIKSINGGAQAVFLNRYINGGMQISQRGAVNCSNGSYYGGCDRYIVQTSATTVTAGQVQQAVNASMASGFSQQIAGITTTGSSTIGIKQRFESTAVADFNSKTITISGKAYQNTGVQSISVWAFSKLTRLTISQV